MDYCTDDLVSDCSLDSQLYHGGLKRCSDSVMELVCDESGGQAPAPKGKMRKRADAVKSAVQSNSIIGRFFPPTGNIAFKLTLLLAIITVFVTARAVLGKIAAPGGTIFALEVLILVALIGGYIVVFIGNLIGKVFRVEVRVPALLGMLIVGILLKNIPYNFGQFGRAECTKDNQTATFVDSINDLDDIDEHSSFKKRSVDPLFDVPNEFFSIDDNLVERFRRSAGGGEDDDHHEDDSGNHTCVKRYIGHDLDPYISRTLRTICLTVILLMAGLELDPVALWNLSGMVLRATFIPCFVEAVMVALLSHFILGFTWIQGFALGFVLAAVSPAVIIPCLMSLSERGYGVAKGIPTLVIAACSADDVVAISGFGIFMGITFKKDASLVELIFHGPIELAIGLAFGILWGILAQWIPNKDHKNVAFFRWLILFGGGLIALFGAHLIHYDGAGGLATITMAFVAGMQWRKEGWGDHNPVSRIFSKMWLILEPVIFALIGTEIQIDKIDPETLGYGILVLVISLVVRMAGTYVAVMGGELNVREKIFMSFAWMPKATVQAALGPIFLDNAKKAGLTEMYHSGEQILTLAVLSILITAPLGAVAILGLGPHLLETDKKGKNERNQEDANL